MKKLHLILIVAAAVQIPLVGLTWFWRTRGTRAATATHALFADLSADDVTALHIEDLQGGKNAVSLKRTDDGWIVSSNLDYPADAEQVDKVVDSLLFEVGAPIDERVAHHHDLGVDEAAANRKVVIETGEKKHTLWMGAGNRLGAYVRADEEPAVYQAKGVAAWDIPATPLRFYERALVDMDAQSIERVIVQNPRGRLELIKTGGTWASPSLTAEQHLDGLKVNAFVGTLVRVNIHEPVAKEVAPAHGLDGKQFVQLSTADDTVRYDIGAEDKGKRYLKVENRPYVVQVTSASVRQALEKTMSDLLADAHT